MKHAAIWAAACCLAAIVCSAEQLRTGLAIVRHEPDLCSIGPPSRCQHQELAARRISVIASLTTAPSVSSTLAPSRTVHAVKWNTPTTPVSSPASTVAVTKPPTITMALPRVLHIPSQVMAEPTMSASKAPSGWSYVGCYGPRASMPRDNSTLSWHSWDSTAINSLDSCAKKCPNSRYYGVANRWDCECGDVVDDKVLIRAPEANCNLTCAWPNDHQFCGGNSYMGVYQVWHNTPSPTKTATATATATTGMAINSTMSSTTKRSITASMTVPSAAALQNLTAEIAKYESVLEAVDAILTAAYGHYPMMTKSSSVTHLSSPIAASAAPLHWPKATAHPGDLPILSTRPHLNHSHLEVSKNGQFRGPGYAPYKPIPGASGKPWKIAKNGTRKSTAAEMVPSFTGNVVGLGLALGVVLVLFY